ncbi:uncharacterized protein LOC135707870 [Ochlerotatus camptorhynchus]|uniref:uncharacterized protein LOC135707870 n=1 Tax=Ochlerotatus camptorhynchus TaxID=644619 RepID=UPI0031DE8A32
MMGSRLLQNVCSAVTLNIRKRFLWIDLATVLAWLRSDSRRYHQFVSFRVGEILSLTSVDEWHYVPSKLNVADDATRWNSGPSFDPDNRWFQGPSFLRDTKELWPRESAVVVAETDAARVGDRIGCTPHIPYAAKHPVVLPRDHRITFLLEDSFHQRFLHTNGETVCNELRQEFYIPNLRALVRKVSRSCQHCKVKKAVPVPPLMRPLPRVRITPFIRPFTFVGVDYMGPFEVKVGHSVVKRWICLFTCLTIRAVHLELVHSLLSIACGMAFRRFVARRGAPLEVFSDNGTNFVGANRQLSEAKQRIQNIIEDCAATFTNANTQCHFNVRAAPHMEGPWERMVKSVKVAMKAILDSP